MHSLKFDNGELINAFLDLHRTKRTFSGMRTSTSVSNNKIQVLLQEVDVKRFNEMFAGFYKVSEGHLDVFSEIGD